MTYKETLDILERYESIVEEIEICTGQYEAAQEAAMHVTASTEGNGETHSGTSDKVGNAAVRMADYAAQLKALVAFKVKTRDEIYAMIEPLPRIDRALLEARYINLKKPSEIRLQKGLVFEERYLRKRIQRAVVKLSKIL